MGRSPCCDENGLKKGPWTPEEDHKLIQYIEKHGHGSWRALPKLAGLNRCGKSCRLRWTNYLRPDIKRGKFSPEEEQAILNLHSVLGNKWSAIATRLPGRTDNEIKNFWNTHLKKKLIQMGFDPMTHRPRTDIFASLPHLIALANLKELMDCQPWDDHSVRLQQAEAVEMAKLQCLQYLLRSATDTKMSNIMEPIPFMPTMDATSLTHFSNFHQDQLMHVPCNVPNQYNQLDQTGLAPVVRLEDENNMKQTSSVSPESCVLPPLTDVSIGNTGDACSTSSYDGCGTASNGALLWHDLFMDDSFITPFV